MIKLFKIIKDVISQIRDISNRVQKLQQALGRIEERQTKSINSSVFNENEFQVYSQWGEDGLIQYILNNIEIKNTIFVEFGVETYKESNTRFLLTNKNWSGLVIDGSETNIEKIKKDPIYWKHNLKAECAFIDKDNINELIEKNGVSGDIGLLSVDIDGNDYWVWEAIDVIDPRIVICEYNSLYGDEKPLSVPYDPAFYRTNAHSSNLYWGASISAFVELGKSKGYSLIGSNIAGNNIFFVKNEFIGNLTAVTPKTAYVQSQFREAKDLDGKLTYLPFEQRLNVIADMPLIDIVDNRKCLIGEFYGLK